MRTRALCCSLALGSLALSGCPTNNTADGGTDTPTLDAPVADVPRVDAPTDVPPLPDVPSDVPPAGCPAVTARTLVTVTADVTANTTWTCDNNYLLAGTDGPVFVRSGATLTIEPGVVVRGQVRDGTRRCEAGPMMGMACTDDAACPMSRCGAPAELGTALVVQRGGRLVADGTSVDPIVFTSERTGTATAPAPGDWGGIVLLGAAPTNNDPPDGAQIEGLPTDGRGSYGGSDAAHDCGSLSYVRIEYAGFVFGRNNELNGLTVGGCGTGTDLHHIHIHRGLDDGIEFFGGTVNLHHAIVTGTGDDSLDWDLGWTGNVQFFIAQQRNVPGEERCIEGDNHPSLFARTPRTAPTVYNFTCIGAGNAPGVSDTLRATLNHDSVILRRGSAGTIRNSIFFGSPDRGIQIDDQEMSTMTSCTAVGDCGASGASCTSGLCVLRPADSDTVQLYTTGTTIIENNILFDIGDTGTEAVFSSDPLRAAGATTRTSAEIVADLLMDNRNVDPNFGGNPNDPTTPDFTPDGAVAADAAHLSAEPIGPAGFWEDVSYAGAVDPSETPTTAWYSGWTRFTD